jgi:glycosyltransferase involved in cell wall biosynthesis
MLEISIIIPSKNEEKYISRCIDSLLCQEGVILDKEIIVVDNGSSDNTIRILKSYHNIIKYYVLPELSIAGLRNYGVENSSNEWIAFVDADVEVDRYWGKMLVDFLEEQKKKGVDVKNIITGSTCLVPDNPTWVEYIWYEQLIKRDSDNVKYINSGNMIIYKELFEKLGGFNVSYRTGEEENLCEIARQKHNVLIIKNNRMRAIHHGYPKTIGAFFQRMRWHGKGMFKYISKPWKSKPLMLALYYIFLTVVSLLLFVSLRSHFYIIFVLFLLFQVLPVLIFSMSRWNGKMKNFLLLALLYLCFGWARAVSIVDVAFHREITQNK